MYEKLLQFGCINTNKNIFLHLNDNFYFFFQSFKEKRVFLILG